MIKSIVEEKYYRLFPFVFENQTIMETAKHYLFHRTASPLTFACLSFIISRFCIWIGKTPDQLIKECFNENGEPQAKTLIATRQKIDEYIFYLKERKLRSTTICCNINYITSFFTINRVNLNLNFRLRTDNNYRARAITVEEIKKVLQVSDLREKAIVSILAVSGLRTNTLKRLQYRHVKKDLERGNFPVHLGIEQQITKGKYNGYSTFINRESADYLMAYLNSRRKGTNRIQPEKICDDSPLFRVCRHKSHVESMSADAIGKLLRSLFIKSKVYAKCHGKDFHRYELDPNSFRKFFRSQMSVLGVQRQFIEYMMGHKTDQYLDVKMAGIEYLRDIYNLSGISLSPTEGYDRLALLKQAIERLDLKPQEVLRPEILKKMNLT
jgi:site-specific recombinase XerD